MIERIREYFAPENQTEIPGYLLRDLYVNLLFLLLIGLLGSELIDPSVPSWLLLCYIGLDFGVLVRLFLTIEDFVWELWHMTLDEALSVGLEPIRSCIEESALLRSIRSAVGQRWHGWITVEERACTLLIDDIDRSIREHIIQLDQLGFRTSSCCSGIEADHIEGEMRWDSYVSFLVDDSAEAQMLFSIGHEAGWKADYGLIGVGLRIEGKAWHEVLELWDRLLDTALCHVDGGRSR
jgi:hypothetical protein